MVEYPGGWDLLMNPIFTAAVLAGLKRRLRKCPNYKRQQVAPVGKERVSVRCQYCKATIPPKEEL
jgi:hypothetical protein